MTSVVKWSLTFSISMCDNQNMFSETVFFYYIQIGNVWNLMPINTTSISICAFSICDLSICDFSICAFSICAFSLTCSIIKMYLYQKHWVQNTYIQIAKGTPVNTYTCLNTKLVFSQKISLLKFKYDHGCNTT